MKKFLLGIFALAIGCSAFAADVRGEAGNLKWLLRNGEMSIVGTTAGLLYTSPSPRDRLTSRMPSSA